MKLLNLLMIIKPKNLSRPRKLLVVIDELLIVFSTKKCAILLLFNGTEVFSSTSNKAKLFVKDVSINFNLDG